MLRFNDTSKVYKNSTFKPSFYALDKYYNLVPSEAGKVKFGVDVKTSKISADGTYYSGSQAAKGYIYAACGDTQSRMSVEIVDKIGSLSVANDFVLLDVGEKVQLQIEAFDENGEKIIISPSAVKWTVEGGIGTADANGVFTAGKNGHGKITASADPLQQLLGQKSARNL